MHCQPAALREVRPECISEGGRKSAPLGPPPVGNPPSPKKRILRQGSPRRARAGHRFFKNVKPAFLGKVPVKSHLLRADKTLFEPMPAVRERRVHPATRRQKKSSGTRLEPHAAGNSYFLFFIDPQIQGPGLKWRPRQPGRSQPCPAQPSPAQPSPPGHVFATTPSLLCHIRKSTCILKS